MQMCAIIIIAAIIIRIFDDPEYWHLLLKDIDTSSHK